MSSKVSGSREPIESGGTPPDSKPVQNWSKSGKPVAPSDSNMEKEKDATAPMEKKIKATGHIGDENAPANIKPSEKPSGSNKVALFSLPMFFMGKSKVAPEVQKEDGDSCKTAPISDSEEDTLPDPVSQNIPALLEDLRLKITSCHKPEIPIRENESVSDLLHAAQSEAKRLIPDGQTTKSVIENLKNTEQTPEIARRLVVLQRLSALEGLEESREDLEALSLPPMPDFVAKHESLKEDSRNLRELLRKPVAAPQTPFSQLKGLIIECKKQDFIQTKQNFLKECGSLKEESQKEIDICDRKSSAMKGDKNTAFKTVYEPFLSKKKELLTRQIALLDTTIGALKKERTEPPSPKASPEKMKDQIDSQWLGVHDDLYALSKAQKDVVRTELSKAGNNYPSDAKSTVRLMLSEKRSPASHIEVTDMQAVAVLEILDDLQKKGLL